MSTPQHIKRRCDLFLAVAFTVMLSLPMLYSRCGWRTDKAIDEHRSFADFPGFANDPDMLKLYGQDLEKYYADHFGGREMLIAGHLKLERMLSPNMSARTMTGRDGWMFTRDESTVDNFLGTPKLSLRQLKSRQLVLEERRDQLAALGIRYLFVISPNKESVYPQNLPDWLQPAAATITQTDQFVDYMRLHSTVEILDLRPVLREASGFAPLFYKTDGHWNLLGAAVAGDAIFARLAGQRPTPVAVVATNFALLRTNGTGGEIARLAGRLDLQDDAVYSTTPGTWRAVQGFNSSTGQINPRQFGSLPVEEIMSLNATNAEITGRAVIFGDSYTFALTPFLGRHFASVNVLRKNFNLEDVDRIRPTIVIDEKVERWLHASFPRG